MGTTFQGIVFPDPTDPPRRQDLEDLAVSVDGLVPAGDEDDLVALDDEGRFKTVDSDAYATPNELAGVQGDLLGLLNLVLIGREMFGGFFAGVIDTDKHSGDIDPNDVRQTGKRYALIVSPRAIGEPSSDLRWRTTQTGVPEARTRWDGLYVTDHIIDNETLSDFPIYEFCDQVRSSNPVPDDGGSDWYIPALDEMELLYRNFKPDTVNNFTGERSRDFPTDPFDNGSNVSSDPQGSAYTEANPAQTTVEAFKLGNAEAMDFSIVARYWSATEANSDRAWYQAFRGQPGLQANSGKDQPVSRCRLVRRVELS